ncbi:MAG: hypothetical protein HY435_02380 [Candidatus Liptonbacteria bacterium]|nr:hypothetical protein [Candidatus Liptonbacteria bacterium]
MKKKIGFAHIGLLVLLAIVVVGGAAILTQINRPPQGGSSIEECGPKNFPVLCAPNTTQACKDGMWVCANSTSGIPYGDDAIDFESLDTSSWKTYRNEEYGFEFKYPREWTTEHFDFPSIVDISEHPEWRGASGGVFIEAINSKTLEDVLEDAKDRQLRQGRNRIASPEIVTIAGVQVIRQSYVCYEVCAGTTYTFPEKGFELNLVPVSGRGDNPEEYSRQTLDAILTSLKLFPIQGISRTYCERIVDQAIDYYGSSAGYPKTSVISECEKYIGSSCSDNSECGAFPCVSGKCFVKACQKDSVCSSWKESAMCGLHATPLPRFCTTVDVQ